MKKALILVLALVIVLGMSSFVFAQDSETNIGGTLTHIHIHHFKIGLNISPITQDAAITNLALAQSGDAVAIGNISDTNILSIPVAVGIGGNATSKSKIKVINKGEAWATSGNAKAINSGDNKIIQKANVDFQQ